MKRFIFNVARSLSSEAEKATLGLAAARILRFNIVAHSVVADR
jgi:hypothetical protein